MSKKLIIFGAGGFSKSIIDSLNHKHYELGDAANLLI